MIVDAVSVIPEVFGPYVDASILGRAQKAGLLEFRAHDLREWTHDRHRTVDDAPFGGGPGMLMKPAPIFEAVRAVQELGPVPAHVVFFSPCGKPFDQAAAERLSREERLLFVCGRYEGMDERAYSLADEVLSLGDYVLTGGELAALTVTDAAVRLIPGVLGGEGSADEESFSEGLLEFEQYTRPAVFEGMAVPDVLLSGVHGRIKEWRRSSALERTYRWRPDLLETAPLSEKDRDLLADIAAGLEDENPTGPRETCS